MLSRTKRSISLSLLCLLTSNHLPADPVYKSIDKNGKTSYATSPTDDHSSTVKISILPPPSKADVKDAHDRHQKNIETEKIVDESRKQRSEEIAERNRIRREKKQLAETRRKSETTTEEGPYYGIPGHGILVLPKGPRIQP